MKKTLLSALLLFSLLVTQLVTPAALAAEGDGAGTSSTVESMYIQAKAAILVDDDYGEVLYEQNAHEKNYPASITKVMTTLLVLEAVDRGEAALTDIVTVGDEVNLGIGEGGSGVGLQEGEQLSLEDLLYCALTASANEACNALAQYLCGDVATFVERMNQRAAELGMENTHFTNTHGYHDENHYTTAYDIYLMCHEAMQNPTFRTIVSSVGHEVPATNMSEARSLHETNALVSTWRITGYWYQYATGIKTGSTPEAGYCLASSATKGDRHLIAVVLGAENPKNADGSTNRLQFAESTRLLEMGFNDFSRQTILDETDRDFPEVAVTLSSGADYVTVQPSGALEATLPNDIVMENFERKVDLPAEVEAPVEAGEKLGTVTLTYDGQEYGTLDLVATASVERSELLYRLDRIQRFFDQLWVKIVLAVLAVLIVFLILRRLILGRSRSRYGGGRRSGGYSGGRRYSGRRRR